ncbi:MAG TPA: protein kinase, partial [Kofleriaceae bacterium]|nr:protein kinase [Kofleriaceae bacterium]
MGANSPDTSRGGDAVEHRDVLLAEGTCVDTFQICGFLGEGAMGQVYLAQDTLLGRRVALKFIKRSIVESQNIERFLEEARATASFNHPHIVTLHAAGDYDGQPYLALEYLDGE